MELNYTVQIIHSLSLECIQICVVIRMEQTICPNGKYFNRLHKPSTLHTLHKDSFFPLNSSIRNANEHGFLSQLVLLLFQWVVANSTQWMPEYPLSMFIIKWYNLCECKPQRLPRKNEKKNYLKFQVDFRCHLGTIETWKLGSNLV